MSTLYFNNEVDTNPATAGNYWTDAGCETPAAGVPTWSADTVHVVSGATFRIPAAATLALTVAAQLIADAGSGLVIDAGGTLTLATGTQLNLAADGVNAGTFTAASGATITIATGKTLTCIAGSTTTVAPGVTMAGAGTISPQYGATATINGVTLTLGPTTAPSADKISVALEFASQIQSGTARLPAKASLGDYSTSTLAASRLLLIEAQATTAATAYRSRTGDTTAVATLAAEFETLIAQALLVASQAEVAVDNAVAALLV